MGLVIGSSRMAARLSTMFDTASPAIAYRVTLGADGALQWHDGNGATFDTEPEASWEQRAMVRVFSWLPIEWLL